MITRIVRMEFAPDRLQDFLSMFHATKTLIRHFPGVLSLELHRDADLDNVYFTVSEWESAEALEAYRTSALFQTVWNETKTYFGGRPQAFSLVSGMVVD
jgi:(4S)-4-hydroxy-5-phosphonooxypentane-2,3-dione isomerase